MSPRRFKPYPDYKDSGVEWLGEIPAHWEIKRLKYGAELNPSPLEVRRLSPEAEVSFVPMEAVCEFGGLDLTRAKLIADVGSGYTYFGDGDVVVAKITPCFENGKGALAAGLTNSVAFGTTELHVLRALDPVDRKYLFYATMADAFRRLGEAEMYGAGGQKRVPETFIENLKHPMPPKPEQLAIAAFLDRETSRINSLVAKKERLIELLQEKRTALITRAVTKGLDPNVAMKDSGFEWLGEIPVHWEVKRLKHLALNPESGIQMGPFGSMLKDLAVVDTGYKLYGQENTITGDFGAGSRWITGDQYHDFRQYRIRPGDIVLTRKGSLGNARIVPSNVEPGVIDSDTIRVRVDHDAVALELLVLLLHEAQYVNGQIGSVRRGAVLGGLNTATIANLILCVPPRQEQVRLMKQVQLRQRVLDRLLGRVREAIDRLKEYRTALISAAVTGKIDVRNVA